MPMGDFFDDLDTFLDDDLSKPKKPPVWQPPVMTDMGVTYPALRTNPQNGLTQIQVRDPDRPGQSIWVDATWDAVRDKMVPVDRKYRDPSDSPALYRVGNRNPLFTWFDDSGSAINFSGPLGDTNTFQTSGPVLPVAATSLAAPAGSGSSAGWIIVAVVLVAVWTMNR
jgi:hypothetical protein